MLIWQFRMLQFAMLVSIRTLLQRALTSCAFSFAGKKTFMRMVESQAGLGLGIKKFMLVWVFDDKEAFDSFVNSGWTFDAQATAAAKDGKKGGSD